MNKSNRNIIIGIFVLIWFALITILYFVTHKPFTPELAMAISMNIWRVVIAGMITSIAGGIGLRFLKLENLHPLARLGIDAAFGYGVLALVMMVIGLLHGFTILIFIPLVVILVVLLRKEIIAWWKLFGSIPGIWKETTATWRVAGIILGGMVLFSLCAALAPPVKYDALMYHLTHAGCISKRRWIGILTLAGDDRHAADDRNVIHPRYGFWRECWCHRFGLVVCLYGIGWAFWIRAPEIG